MLFCKDSFLEAEVTPWYLQAMWENQQDQDQPVRYELAAIFLPQGSFSAVFSQSQTAILNIHRAPASTPYSVNNSQSSPPKPPQSPALVRITKTVQFSPISLQVSGSKLSCQHPSCCRWREKSAAAVPRGLPESYTRAHCKSHARGRLSILISTLASFPGSLSLITDFKFPVSAEWEEGSQWVFLEYFRENTQSRLEKMYQATSVLAQPLLCFLHSLHCCPLCTGMSGDIPGSQTKIIPLCPSWATHILQGAVGRRKALCPSSLWSQVQSSLPQIKEARWWLPDTFSTLIPVLDQLDPAIWELMLRS